MFHYPFLHLNVYTSQPHPIVHNPNPTQISVSDETRGNQNPTQLYTTPTPHRISVSDETRGNPVAFSVHFFRCVCYHNNIFEKECVSVCVSVSTFVSTFVSVFTSVSYVSVSTSVSYTANVLEPKEFRFCRRLF